jgi:DNA-binding GntR family transcriptional regulator
MNTANATRHDTAADEAPRAGEPTSLARAVYDKLKQDILTTELPPRTKLGVEFVCDRYGFGTSPVREALTRLVGEGFVTRIDGRGFSVAGVSVEEYIELTETRCWLEEVALRKAMAKGGPEWEERIVLAFHRFSRLSRPAEGTKLSNNIEWVERHKAFHDALISACGSRWLLSYCHQLREQTYRYRRISAAERPGGALNEHERLMKVVLDRDPSIAVPLLMEHYRNRNEVTLARFRKFEAEQASLQRGRKRRTPVP